MSQASVSIGIPISVEVYNEFVRRMGREKDDVVGVITNVIEDFLERTADQTDMWSAEYADWFETQEKNLGRFTDVNERKYGRADKGLFWADKEGRRVFFPNGTNVRFKYKHKLYYAEIRHQRIHSGDIEYTSMSRFVWGVTNTPRNAWNDIWMKRPTDTEWQFAHKHRLTEPK